MKLRTNITLNLANVIINDTPLEIVKLVDGGNNVYEICFDDTFVIKKLTVFIDCH